MTLFATSSSFCTECKSAVTIATASSTACFSLALKSFCIATIFLFSRSISISRSPDVFSAKILSLSNSALADFIDATPLRPPIFFRAATITSEDLLCFACRTAKSDNFFSTCLCNPDKPSVSRVLTTATFFSASTSNCTCLRASLFSSAANLASLSRAFSRLCAFFLCSWNSASRRFSFVRTVVSLAASVSTLIFSS